MANIPKPIASHFEPLHEMLTRLSAQSNAAWTQGGVVWSYEFQKRAASTLRADGDGSAWTNVRSQDAHLREYSKSWAELIWRAQGDLGDLINIAGGPEWEDEESRLIAERKDQAEWVIKFFETSGANRVRMSFRKDESSMAVDCFSTFGRDVLIHKVYWSID